MNQTDKTVKFFSWLFLSTGIFAIVGAIYTWGEGPLYQQNDLLTALVPWADLVITGPLSLIAAYGIKHKKDWGIIVGLMTCGIYLFGSVLVYITLVWQGAPYPLHLALPPLIGIALGIGYPLWIFLRTEYVFIAPNPRNPGRRFLVTKGSKYSYGSIMKDPALD